MNAANRKPWLRTVILLGLFYSLVGIAFGAFAGWSKSNQMVTAWRVLSFVVSGIAFSLHIAYEHFRFGSRPLVTALRTSLAVAIGAFGLAIAANINSWGVPSSNHRLLALALLTFPLVTAPPAFLVAFIVASVLTLIQRRIYHSG